ncbi:SWIM zinc finger family protein [Anaerocolumna xylanovorans]|uniref:SWIM zinc finger n=1 Tax=Anaerocolumna xylanovorans DSM 12503 TaxID=1121345 RepID=A0A1M7XYF5_9FIRM|nr:SWIM zinc finger family protein [Anaerocolumna xylanovorans]SHO44079.1 SWIM zinc finger [Anaerocolumna xylanovorans DSM 12503]
MSEWKKLLQGVSEEYLTGLTNKGIVKRALKDLEQAKLSLKEEENCLTVQVEDAVCTLVFPLGESKCSCPSRSICKHIIMAALFAKNQYAKKQYSGEEDEKEEAEEGLASVLEYPLAKLKRTIGDKRLQSLYHAFSQGTGPEIAEGDIVTVSFADTGITVRLLEPVEYSSCSCHKKDFCQHKAEAVLSYQIHAGKLTVEDLLPELEENNTLCGDEIKEFGKDLKNFLGEQLSAGLARSSAAVMDSLERLAIISHNYKLPDFERDLRALGGEYQLYFKRTASFQISWLLHKLCSLYRKAEALEMARTKEEMAGLAGEFRTEYLPCPPMKLSGMGQREFVSKAGYEGEIYYFLNEDTLVWYTYTNARPVFYENEKRRVPTESSKAPWGLFCKLEEFAEARLLLYDGKTSKDHRLSATAQAKAEYLGKRRLIKENLKGQYFEDFKQLFEERLADSWQQENEEEKLVLIKPAYIKNTSFDSINQQYSMELYDRENQRIILEVSYSKTEHYTIRFLERLAKRIGQGDMAVPCFFGSLYVKDAAMRLYPINYYEDME